MRKLQSNIQQLNINKSPTHVVQNYLVFELIGAGAFGSVYKVKKSTGKQLNYYAMKEVWMEIYFKGT